MAQPVPACPYATAAIYASSPRHEHHPGQFLPPGQPATFSLPCSRNHICVGRSPEPELRTYPARSNRWGNPAAGKPRPCSQRGKNKIPSLDHKHPRWSTPSPCGLRSLRTPFRSRARHTTAPPESTGYARGEGDVCGQCSLVSGLFFLLAFWSQQNITSGFAEKERRASIRTESHTDILPLANALFRTRALLLGAVSGTQTRRDAGGMHAWTHAKDRPSCTGFQRRVPQCRRCATQRFDELHPVVEVEVEVGLHGQWAKHRQFRIAAAFRGATHLASPRHPRRALLERAVGNEVPSTFTPADIVLPAFTVSTTHVGTNPFDFVDPERQQDRQS